MERIIRSPNQEVHCGDKVCIPANSVFSVRCELSICTGRTNGTGINYGSFYSVLIIIIIVIICDIGVEDT